MSDDLVPDDSTELLLVTGMRRGRAARPQTCWRTAAGTSSTICRRNCSPPWSCSGAGGAGEGGAQTRGGHRRPGQAVLRRASQRADHLGRRSVAPATVLSRRHRRGPRPALRERASTAPSAGWWTPPSTVSRPSESCCASCEPRQMWSSTPRVSTCTSWLARSVRWSDDSGSRLRIAVMSFGFKYGIPWTPTSSSTCDSSPIPSGCPELKALTGQDEPVSHYVLTQPGAEDFLDRTVALPGDRRRGLLERRPPLRDRRRRLHGRQAPQRRDCRSVGPASGERSKEHLCRPPRSGAGVRPHAVAALGAATGWHPRSRHSASSPTTSRPSSQWPTTVDPAGACAASSGFSRPVTSAWPWQHCVTRASGGTPGVTSSSTGSTATVPSPGTLSAISHRGPVGAARRPGGRARSGRPAAQGPTVASCPWQLCRSTSRPTSPASTTDPGRVHVVSGQAEVRDHGGQSPAGAVGAPGPAGLPGVGGSHQVGRLGDPRTRVMVHLGDAPPARPGPAGGSFRHAGPSPADPQPESRTTETADFTAAGHVDSFALERPGCAARCGVCRPLGHRRPR